MFTLKRNRSKSTITRDRLHPHEPANKLLRFFSKLTNSITPHHRHELKRPSMANLASLFKSDSQLSVHKKKASSSMLDKDKNIERQRYCKSIKLKEYIMMESNQQQNLQHKITVPSILISRPTLTSSPSLDQPPATRTAALSSPFTSSNIIPSSSSSSSSSSPSSTSSSSPSSSIKHSPHVDSSNQTTHHSGDLTAKQFADIAGIKILPEGDDDTDDSDWENSKLGGGSEQIQTNSNMPSCSLLDQDKLSISTFSMSSLSRNESVISRSRKQPPTPNIWDSAFWHDSMTESSLTRKISAPPSSPSPQTKQKQHCHHHQNDHPLPSILNELRRINTISNDHLSRHQCQHSHIKRNRSCVIKKGRFEISLETADSTEAASS